MDNATPTLSSSSISHGRKLVYTARHTIVETGSERNNKVGTLHRQVRISRAVHTQHVQTQGMLLIKRAKRMQRGGHRNVVRDGQLAQQRRTILVRQDTVTCVDDGTTSDRDQTRRMFNL